MLVGDVAIMVCVEMVEDDGEELRVSGYIGPLCCFQNQLDELTFVQFELVPLGPSLGFVTS